MQRGKRNNSREEKKLYKIFGDANFGILLDKNSRTREKIIHSGKVQILAKFEGEIIAQAVLIEKTASIAATIAAEVVMCKGRVFGEIRATYKIKIAKGGEVKGYVHTPNFIIEQGAVFDGRCSMPNIKRPGPLHRLKEVFRKTGWIYADSNLSCLILKCSRIKYQGCIPHFKCILPQWNL